MIEAKLLNKCAPVEKSSRDNASDSFEVRQALSSSPPLRDNTSCFTRVS